MKLVYLFNEYKEKNICDKFGKNGTFLSESFDLGLNIPNGFVITTDACNEYYENNQKINEETEEQINEYILKLEQLTEKYFGDKNNPLLLTLKCSSKNEIPGIMDTISNVGLTEVIVDNLSKDTNDFIWVWESYFKFINDYAKTIYNVDLETYKYVKNILNDKKTTLTKENLKVLLDKLKREYKLKTKIEFPDDYEEQLYSLINAYFKSWSNERANIYRRDMDIPAKEGMAICIQQMPFGNINKNCGIGSIYTRDPITGETKDEFTGRKYFVGKFSRQSVDNKLDVNFDFINEESTLATEFPEIYKQLKIISRRLEKHYEDMIKIDFVVENNKLSITDICKGKRTTKAGLKIQCDIFDEYVLSKKNEDSEERKKVCFDFVFGGFKQKEIEPLESIVKKKIQLLKK